jgi:hypothetical protein
MVLRKYRYLKKLSLSRQATPKLVKSGILTVERVQGAVDYLQ